MRDTFRMKCSQHFFASLWKGFIAFLFFTGVSGRRRKGNADDTQVYSESLSESYESEALKFSAWELTLMTDILIDVSVTRCNIYAGQVSDFKDYLATLVGSSTRKESKVDPDFLELYSILVKCFQKNVEESDESDVDIVAENHKARAAVIKTYMKRFKERQIESEEIATTAPTKAVSSVPQTKIASTSPSTTPAPKKAETKKKESSTILGSVKHLFTKLYENTASIFSSIFDGRRKRHTGKFNSGKRDANFFADDTDEEDDDEDENAEPYYAKRWSSYTKPVFDRNVESIRRLGDVPETSAYFQRTKRVREKQEEDANTKSLAIKRTARSHFRNVLSSMIQVAKRSCPSIMPSRIVNIIETAVDEVLTFVDKDIGRRAEKDDESKEEFSLNYLLQRKMQQCSRDTKF